eukprot:5508603-Prymnesium_polylepis.1
MSHKHNFSCTALPVNCANHKKNHAFIRLYPKKGIEFVGALECGVLLTEPGASVADLDELPKAAFPKHHST